MRIDKIALYIFFFFIGAVFSFGAIPSIDSINITSTSNTSAGVWTCGVGASDGDGNTTYASYLFSMPGSGPVLYLDANAPNATDISGYDNHGELVGVLPALNGSNGGGFMFNGSFDYINISHSESLNVTEAFTILVFGYGIGKDSSLISKRDGSGLHYRVALNSDGELMVETTGLTTNSLTQFADYSLKNDWLMYGAGYNGTHLYLIYMGEIVKSTASTGLIDAGTGVLHIGRDHTNGVGHNLTGELDNIMIFNYSLYAEQLLNINNTPDQLAAQETAEGDTWTCSAIVSDLADYSAPASVSFEIQAAIPYYNQTHPRITYTDQDYYGLANTSTISYISERFAQFKTDAGDIAAGSFSNSSYHGAGKASTVAYQCYGTNDTNPCQSGLEWLTGLVNQSDAWWVNSDAGVHYAAAETGKAYDWMYGYLTDAWKEYIINRLYTIVTSRLADTSLGFNATIMSNNNGQADDLAECVIVYAIAGEYANDTAMTTEIDQCDNMVENFPRSYFDTEIGLEGVAYDEFIKYYIDALIAYELHHNTTVTTASICGIADAIPQLYYQVKTTGRAGNTLTHSEHGDSYRSANFDPRGLAFLADRCNVPELHYLISMQQNYTTEHQSYNNAMYQTSASEFTVYNHSIAAQAPTTTAYYDGAGLVTWRTGYNWTTDLIIQCISRDPSVSHPNADLASCIFLYNGMDMMTEGGFRNNTGEIPKDVLYHNTMMVNATYSLTWAERGSVSPSVFMYWGANTSDYPLSSECSESNYTTCHIKSDSYRGQITGVVTASDYNEMVLLAPYYTFNNVTNRVVYIKAADHPIIIRRWYVQATAWHNLSFLVNTETGDLTTSGSGLLVDNNGTYMRVQPINTSALCNWKINYSEYGKQEYGNALSGQYLYTSSYDCGDVQNYTNILTYSLYKDAAVEHTILPYSNATHEGIMFNRSGNTEYYLFTMQDPGAAVIHISTAIPDTTSPIIQSITNTTSNNSVTIVLTLDEAGNASLHVSTNANLTGADIFNGTGYDTSHTIQATGLTNNTLYYMVVNGSDASGNIYTSAIFNITTDQNTETSSTTTTSSTSSVLIAIAALVIAAMFFFLKLGSSIPTRSEEGHTILINNILQMGAIGMSVYICFIGIQLAYGMALAEGLDTQITASIETLYTVVMYLLIIASSIMLIGAVFSFIATTFSMASFSIKGRHDKKR